MNEFSFPNVRESQFPETTTSESFSTKEKKTDEEKNQLYISMRNQIKVNNKSFSAFWCIDC